MTNFWDERYQTDEYVFGEQPNAFLASQVDLVRRHRRALAVADGEGRNGVWLAEQGLEVVSIDASAVGLAKARRLAARDEALFARIVMAAFTQRRKTLRNALRALAGEEVFARAGVDPGLRGETLSVAQFVALADAAAGA